MNDSVTNKDTVYLTVEEVAARLRIEPATLDSWAARKSGPPIFKSSPKAKRLYPMDGLVAWEKERTSGGDENED